MRELRVFYVKAFAPREDMRGRKNKKVRSVHSSHRLGNITLSTADVILHLSSYRCNIACNNVYCTTLYQDNSDPGIYIQGLLIEWKVYRVITEG